MHAGGLEGRQDGKVIVTTSDTSFQYMDVLVSNGTVPGVPDVFPSFKLGLNM